MLLRPMQRPAGTGMAVSGLLQVVEWLLRLEGGGGPPQQRSEWRPAKMCVLAEGRRGELAPMLFSGRFAPPASMPQQPRCWHTNRLAGARKLLPAPCRHRAEAESCHSRGGCSLPSPSRWRGVEFDERPWKIHATAATHWVLARRAQRRRSKTLAARRTSLSLSPSLSLSRCWSTCELRTSHEVWPRPLEAWWGR